MSLEGGSRMDRIDPDTAEKVRRILAVSRLRGVDPVDALELAGLLRHKASRLRDERKVLESLINTVRDLKIPRDVRTPMDLRRAIVMGLEGALDDAK
jgi:hypothetical protein